MGVTITAAEKIQGKMYNPATGVIVLQFRDNGAIYKYTHVPPELGTRVDEATLAECGDIFFTEIKNNPNLPYVRIG